MESTPERTQTRRQQIGKRVTAIRTRLAELQEAQQAGTHPVSSGGQLGEAQQHAAISDAAAQRALTASIDAFQRAAEAHERLAAHYEQAAAAGVGDQEVHRERAAYQRAAAATDRQRAETAQSLLAARAADSQQEG